MRRRTKAIIVGTFTGSALLGGTGLAMAHEGHFGSHHNVHLKGQGSTCTQVKGESDDDGEGSAAKATCTSAPKPTSTGTVKPTGAPTPAPTGTTASPTVKPTTPAPTGTTTSSCTSYTGAAGNTASPGSGTVTVTINVCNGVVSSATAVQVDNSGYSTNKQAIPALNALVPANYKSAISKITYSGATRTSAAYQTSLQSALTKAGL